MDLLISYALVIPAKKNTTLIKSGSLNKYKTVKERKSKYCWIESDNVLGKDKINEDDVLYHL